MSLVEIKLTVRQFFDDIYNQRNLDSIDSLLTPGFVYHARGEDVEGIENFKKWISSDRAAFPDMQFTDNRQIGFSAQEVEKLFPEVVMTDVNGYKSVDYGRLTPVLAGGVCGAVVAGGRCAGVGVA